MVWLVAFLVACGSTGDEVGRGGRRASPACVFSFFELVDPV